MTADESDPRCPHCGSLHTSKLVSRPGRFRVEDDRIEEVADRLERLDDSASLSEMRSAIRDVGKALDDDASEEMEELFEEDLADDSAADDA